MTRDMALPDDFLESVKRLCLCARTTGGIAGRDDDLCRALDRVEAMLKAIYDPRWQAQAKGKVFKEPAETLHHHDYKRFGTNPISGNDIHQCDCGDRIYSVPARRGQHD